MSITNKINDITFKNEYNLAYKMLNDKNEYESVCCIADSETIKSLLSCFLTITNGNINIVEIIMKKDYETEVFLTLDNKGIWIESASCDKKFCCYTDDLIYISEECNSMILSFCKNKKAIVNSFSYLDDKKEVCVSEYLWE